MGKLVEHLMRCAVCGAVPKISDTANIDKDPNPEHCYKLFCSKCGVHNSCGNWFENKYKACLDWNKRQIENEDGEKPIKTLGEKLSPCPFCGRKMVFYRETHTNKYGKQVVQQYYLHEDYDIYHDESCILDEIDMPFTIGAGDANPGTGYIGEYAEKWNRRWDNKWRTNPKIKSPLANISGLCCVHCDHKDEYIIELQEENEKLKRLLKMAADELEEKMNNLCEVTSYCSTYSACTQCLYSQVCADVEDYAGGARWIHMNEVDKLLNAKKVDLGEHS